MKNKKRIIFLIRHLLRRQRIVFVAMAVAVVLGVGWFFLFGAESLQLSSLVHENSDTPSKPQIILFEGDNCSHCLKVDNFIKQYNLEDTVTFTRLEVFNNSKNANLLADKAQTCGIPQNQIGVPFLWDGSRCILGYVDVIQFFREKIVK